MRLSASSIPRAMACVASAALPRIESTATEWMRRGTALHAFLADVSKNGREAALERVAPEHRAACEALDLDRLPAAKPESYAVEVALAYDVDTGKAREIGRDTNRRYDGLGAREIPGTVDVVGLMQDAVVVLDYKSGFTRQAPAVEHWQLRTYGLMAARTYNRARAIVGIVRLLPDGGAWFEQGTLDAFELASIAEDLRALADRVTAAEGEVAAGRLPPAVMGDHCSGCPAYQVCPAQMSLVRQFAAAPESLEDQFRRATPEQLASAYERAVALERVAERVREGIKRLAREKPIDLGNGYVLGAKPEDRIDAAIAIRVLTETYGPEVAAEASHAEPKVSKSSIEDALRKYALKPGKKITHLMRDAIAAIRAAGGVKQVQVIERHKPKQEQLKEGVAA